MTTLNDYTPEARRLLEEQTIELPSWAFGNSGTRFKVFTTGGVPRTPYEKLEDAAQVNAYTGITPRVSLHIPWDRVDDFADLAAYATDHGVAIGAINSNVFQDDDYKLGSLCHSDQSIRTKAINHHRECIDIMNQTGSTDLKIWLADGTNYPGRIPSAPAKTASPTPSNRSMPTSARANASSWNTSSSSPRFTTPIFPTGVPRWCTARHLAPTPWWFWTPDTTPQAPTSSSLLPSSCVSDGSVLLTSTPASTRTTTSWSVPLTPSSFSASCTKLSPWERWTKTPA